MADIFTTSTGETKMTHRFVMSWAEYLSGHETQGLCLSCGSTRAIEPGCKAQLCEACKAHSLASFDVLLERGVIQLDDEQGGEF